jgi:Uma2 family endonuclease
VFVAPLDVVLSEENVVQPDIVFVADDDTASIEESCVRGAPAWLIEVVSDPVRDKKAKRELYTGHGVGEYWAVDVELRRIEIFRPSEDPMIVEPPAGATPKAPPALTIPVAPLFAD